MASSPIRTVCTRMLARCAARRRRPRACWRTRSSVAPHSDAAPRSSDPGAGRPVSARRRARRRNTDGAGATGSVSWNTNARGSARTAARRVGRDSPHHHVSIDASSNVSPSRCRAASARNGCSHSRSATPLPSELATPTLPSRTDCNNPVTPPNPEGRSSSGSEPVSASRRKTTSICSSPPSVRNQTRPPRVMRSPLLAR